MKTDFKGMMNAITLNAKRKLPDILVFAGISGIIGGAVMACVATRKLDGVLENHKSSIKAVHKKYELTPGSNDEKKEITKVYMDTGVSMIRLYGPAIGLGTVSIASIITGNNIHRKRNIALAAAYTAVDTGFKTYRSRVVERFGDEVDKELRAGTRQEVVTVVETDEDGNKREVEKSITVVDDILPSEYARYFCYGEARGAEPNYEYNLFFLGIQQNTANRLLMTNGYLFLNDVYDMLGITRSIPGQVVGWVYDRNSDTHGDNHIDFRIQEVYRKKDDGSERYEKVILLDFNVDGSILDHSIDKGLIVS